MGQRYAYLKIVINRNYRILLIIGFVIGCILYEETKVTYLTEVIAVLCIVSFIIVPRFGVILLLVLFGFLRVVLANHVSEDHVAFHLNDEAGIRASVISYPQIRNQEQILILRPVELNIDKSSVKIRKGYLQLKLSKYIKIGKGDLLSFSAYLEEPENFDGFDYKGHLKSQNIYVLVKNPEGIEISNNQSIVDSVISKIRTKIIHDINLSFPDPHAKLLAGMLIGTREQFSSDFANNLSITSTSHVVAVSGYNISLVSSSILRLSGFIHRKLLILLSFIGISFFLLLVGLDNLPAFRAGLMGFVMLIAIFIGRRGAGVFSLFLIAGFMHLQNPFIYNSLSFQLSFSATLGLMLLSSNLSSLLSRVFKNKFNMDEISTTFSALIVTFPITFFNFGKITVYGLLANLLIAPLIVFITFLGILFIVVNSLSTGIGYLIKTVLWGLLETMVRIVDVIATFPYSDLGFSENLSLVSIFAIITIVAFVFELNYREFSSKND